MRFLDSSVVWQLMPGRFCFLDHSSGRQEGVTAEVRLSTTLDKFTDHGTAKQSSVRGEKRRRSHRNNKRRRVRGAQHLAGADPGERNLVCILAP